MSSRDDRRRRDRSWERDERARARHREGDKERDRDKDKGRDRDRRHGAHGSSRMSRSRSPPRRGERGRKENGRDRYDDRRDRYHERDRLDERRDAARATEEREIRRDRVPDRARDGGSPSVRSGPSQVVVNGPGPKRTESDQKMDQEEAEEGEEMEPMDAEDDDEAAMRGLMGFGGFDSTKGKPVLGNEDGAVDIKKQRTWRQYMNRKGGFNRPLDKIK